MSKDRTLWERHSNRASDDKLLISPSIGSKVVKIRIILGGEIPTNNCDTNIEAQLLTKVIKLKNIRRGSDSIFLRSLRIKSVSRITASNIGDSSSNCLGSIEHVDLYGWVVEIDWFRH